VLIVVCRWIKSFQQRQCTLKVLASTKQEAKMRTRGGFHRKIGKVYLSIGFSFHRFALGFTFSKKFIDIDLAFFWIGVEF